MNGDVDEKLLAKYVAGACSEQEKALVRDWIARDPGAADRLARLRRDWEAAGVPSSHWNAEAAWEKLSRRVQNDRVQNDRVQNDNAAPLRPAPSSPLRDRLPGRPRRKPPRRRTARSGRRHWLRVAAGGLVVVALALVATLLMEPSLLGPAEPKAKVFTAERGQQAIARLTDGTRVRLNADSRLTIPAGDFAADRREVRLEGEAYFEVAQDTTRPFIVHVRNASVQVLGTIFSVQAYAGENKTRVSVAEGKVALRAQQPEGRGAEAVLRPRSLAIVSDRGLQDVRRGVELSQELAWIEGRLVFEDAPFGEVAKKLERWYDIQVEVALPTDAIVGLNATFEDAPLGEVLHDIAVALNLKYRRDGRSVTFYR